jgi:hypothetical protein
LSQSGASVLRGSPARRGAVAGHERPDCPQCQDFAFTVGNIKLASVASGLKDAYASLLDRMGEPRGSVEEGGSTEDDEMV